MNKIKNFGLILMTFLSFLFMACPNAVAYTLLFQDNFNSENGGIGMLDYNSFANWDVIDGTVDVLGNGFVDYLSYFYSLNQGLYIDLDGSILDAGRMVSKQTFALEGGEQYELKYGLAGSLRGDANVVTVVLGGLVNVTHSLAYRDPYAIYTQTFLVPSNTTIHAQLSFENSGGDNYGAFLDDVTLAKLDPNPVPEPATIFLIGSGLLGIARFGRKFKK